MDLAFRIEHQTSILCGAPTGADMAFLLIAKSQGRKEEITPNIPFSLPARSAPGSPAIVLNKTCVGG
jgi:hypothetical protein